jgi:hypothetical protein
MRGLRGKGDEKLRLIVERKRAIQENFEVGGRGGTLGPCH